MEARRDELRALKTAGVRARGRRVALLGGCCCCCCSCCKTTQYAREYRFIGGLRKYYRSIDAFVRYSGAERYRVITAEG